MSNQAPQAGQPAKDSTMAELTAMDTAYHAIAPLSPAARERAVNWLTSRLESELTDERPS